jgi:hypothetical protein
MGYITINTNVDVEVDYNEITDLEILEIIEDRLDTYKRRKNDLAHSSLIWDIEEVIEEQTASSKSDTRNIDDESLLGELKLEVCKKLMSKYSLEQLETFLNK